MIHTCPRSDLDHHGMELTIDFDGKLRFGPIVEQIGDSSTYSADPDFWQAHLIPFSDRLTSIGAAIHEYLPHLRPSLLTPDYAEIQPNIGPPDTSFSDFFIRHSRDRRGLVELLGFNSPGLTSSLAVGEYVAGMVRRDVWKDGKDQENIETLAAGWE